MSLSEELANVFEKMLDEKLDEKIKILEETYFANSMQTKFTLKELGDKWRCSPNTAYRILKASDVKPIGKSGKEHLFSLEKAEEAKDVHDKKELRKHEISWRARALKIN